MQFSFLAKDAAGADVRGTIEATSKLEAADKLFNEQKLNVVSIDEVGTSADVSIDNLATEAEEKQLNKPLTLDENEATKLHIGEAQSYVSAEAQANKKFQIKDVQSIGNAINDVLIEYSSVSIKDKVIFFRLLSVMINAGLPIVKALRMLSAQLQNQKFKRILSEIADAVEGGSGFARVLADYDDTFNEAERGVIAAGEASGQLNKSLSDLATSTEKNASLAGKIRSAMIYPIIILVIIVLVTIVVMTMVIPKLSELFTGAGVQLPTSTRILMTTSDWFVGSTLFVPNWLLFLLLIIGAIAGVNAWKKTKSGHLMWDSLMLRLPIVGGLSQKIALANFAHQLSTLTSSGISIIRAIEITANAVGNEVYKQVLLDVKADVESGVPINESISREEKLFPPLVVSMVAVGEQTAQLATVGSKIADFYDEEINTFVKNLSTIMEPVIIVIVGGLVGLLVAAIMQPIMQIADVATQQ